MKTLKTYEGFFEFFKSKPSADSFGRIYPIDYKISFCEMFITGSNWFGKTVKSN